MLKTEIIEKQTKRILIIDDDRLVVKSLESLLVTEGYDVIRVVNYTDASGAIENKDFDLIISDMRMPHIDCIEIIRKIKETRKNAFRQSQFMLIADYADSNVSEEASRIGIKHFLAKPFDRDLFLRAVGDCLNGEPFSSGIASSIIDVKTLIDDFIKQQQERNKQFIHHKTMPVIGWTNTYVPEEVIMAAGCLPYRIMGASMSISISKSYLSGNISSHVQSILECALSGDYKFFDGAVIGASTDATKRLYDSWIRYSGISFNHLFDIPKGLGENALIHYTESINALREDVERHFKAKIGKESLRNAILTCNKTRRLLLKLNNLRREINPVISPSQMLEICRLAMITDKRYLNDELDVLLGKICNFMEEKEKSPYRILLTGSFNDQDWLLNAIEEAGGSIVCEDNCMRLRYFYGLADEDSEPISAIAKRYVECKIPSAGPMSFERRSSFILDLIREFSIDAVVYYILKFDDPYLFEYPEMKDFLDSKGIPVIRIEAEHNTSAIGQIKTRLQAFMEILKLKRFRKSKADGRIYQKNTV